MDVFHFIRQHMIQHNVEFDFLKDIVQQHLDRQPLITLSSISASAVVGSSSSRKATSQKHDTVSPTEVKEWTSLDHEEPSTKLDKKAETVNRTKPKKKQSTKSIASFTEEEPPPPPSSFDTAKDKKIRSSPDPDILEDQSAHDRHLKQSKFFSTVLNSSDSTTHDHPFTLNNNADKFDYDAQ
jgi:hypothetical protein